MNLNLFNAWGGAVDIPDPNSDISWFGGLLFPNEPDVKNYKYDSLPDYIYTSKFNKDSLYMLRSKVKAFVALQKPALDSFYKSTDSNWFKAFAIFYSPLKPVSPAAAALQTDIDNKFDRYTASIKNENPFLYYVKARLVLLRKFFFDNNEVFFKRGQIPGIGKLMVLFFHCYYLFLLFFGLVGIVLLGGKGIRNNFMALLFCVIPAYCIVIHPLVLRLADNRYLIPVWPFFIACAAYSISMIYNWLKPKADLNNMK